MTDFSPFGLNIFGEPLKQRLTGKLREKFLLPPFSILSALDGAWQDRKRAWIDLGIQSEVGRGTHINYNHLPAPKLRDGKTYRGDASGNEVAPSSAKARAFNIEHGKDLTRKFKQKSGRVFGQDLLKGENPKFDFGYVGPGGRRRGLTKQQMSAYENIGHNYQIKGSGGLLHKGKTIDTKAGEVWEGGESCWQNSGTSIFDPVLCELMYKWFCPLGGQIIDPFAGGSVRGVVAAMMGRRYWGCELRAEQVVANYEQGEKICQDKVRIPVRVSRSMLLQNFHPCESGFITGTCRGRCCESSEGILVTVHPSEVEQIESLGAKVKDGFIVPDHRNLCPFKTDDGFCGIHGEEKPFGCKASPFTLNKNGTLIVRNRYRLLKCYECHNSVPAYKAHRWSLEQIFGVAETERIVGLMESGEGDFEAYVDQYRYDMLVDNDDAKNQRVTEKKQADLEWVIGDSNIMLKDAPEADFIFSCPPYGDLEIYSEEEGDISNLSHDGFVSAYREIIAKSVAKLKNNSFACFVVANFRDKKTGNYHDFVTETIQAFGDLGMPFYNDAILITSISSLAIRVTRQFDSTRKLGKTHQNVLVFCKGDPRIATKKILDSSRGLVEE